MNKERLKEMYEELLEDYKRSEDALIQEFHVGDNDPHTELTNELNERRKKFNEALEETS